MSGIESESWRGFGFRREPLRLMGGWDEVLCGDRVEEALESTELLLLLTMDCPARYAFRSFPGRDELWRRFELLRRHWDDPLPFDEAELSPLVGRYVGQVGSVGRELGRDDLVAMAAGPIVFDEVGSRVGGPGNMLWVDVVRVLIGEARRAVPEPSSGEADVLAAALRETGWAPELAMALTGPLWSVPGLDLGLYLECWIRNAVVAIDDDAIRVGRRRQGGDG